MLAIAVDQALNAFLISINRLRPKMVRPLPSEKAISQSEAVRPHLLTWRYKVPKVCGRTKSGFKFNSSLVSLYLKCSKNIEKFLPRLFLRGISNGDFFEALKHLLGPQAPGLSACIISRLKQDGNQNYQDWSQRDLSKKRFAQTDGQWGVCCQVAEIVTD